MSSRDEILEKVGRAIAASQLAPAPLPSRNYRMEGTDLPGSEAVIADMTEKLEDYTAVVSRTDENGLADEIDSALQDAKTVVVPHGLEKTWTQAAKRNGRKVYTDSPDSPLTYRELDGIKAVVTGARVAISLSGTIILDGEADQGRRAITLIPDKHVIVLRAKDIYPSVPQAVAILGKHPTRPLTWIAGPSATSDIELVRVDGVHGPRRLHVIIVG
ncbi:lactate utilization protein C [Arcanobacterium sp. S3PF19]|uniref:LutC/YkgG family protein n=1 Tax=Arcanobacterium sp. S3PF19 TaxID=1219585 RepID=UPI0005104F48|nr:lactate utilization protein C [Arcanobacterium sp. S3PF19]KGF06112.1 hypothetical protein HMPREF1631_02220 [Arcanobacterium sp. S3PF19]